MTWTTGALKCPHNFLMHAYTHMFVFIYSVRLNGCLFQKGGGGAWGPFFHSEGPLGPLVYNPKTVEATLIWGETLSKSQIPKSFS